MSEQATGDEVYTPKEVAAREKVSVSTVRNWEVRGILRPCYKVKDGPRRIIRFPADYREQLGEAK